MELTPEEQQSLSRSTEILESFKADPMAAFDRLQEVHPEIGHKILLETNEIYAQIWEEREEEKDKDMRRRAEEKAAIMSNVLNDLLSFFGLFEPIELDPQTIYEREKAREEKADVNSFLGSVPADQLQDAMALLSGEYDKLDTLYPPKAPEKAGRGIGD